MNDDTPVVLDILHRSRYTYAERVSLSRHKAFLTPRPTTAQRVEASRLTMEPSPREIASLTDCYGNPFTLFVIDTPHRELLIEAASTVSILPNRSTGSAGEYTVEAVRLRVHQAESREDLQALEFCFPSPYVPRNRELAGYAAECLGNTEHFLEGVGRLMERIHSEFEYDPAVTTVSTPVSDVLSKRRGVCQDFAHLMIGCLRSHDLPARYVSGYLVPSATVVGAQASHAWVSVYSPGTGWVDFDPTNNVSPTSVFRTHRSPSAGHITLAWGRDYFDVSPLEGVMTGGGDHEIAVEVVVSAA